MPIRTASSSRANVGDAVQEIAAAFPTPPRLVVYFASPKLEPAKLALAVQKQFSDAATIGCTTAGELTTGSMFEGGIAAMALDDAAVEDVAIELVELTDIDRNIDTALTRLATQCDGKLGALSPSEYVGIILTDGLSNAEESVMEALGDRTVIPFVGGSAGDDLAFEKTMVFANGQARSNATALALIKPKVPFEVLKTQSFDLMEPVFEVTEVDESTRTVKTLNGQPAAQAYANALGTTVEELPHRFMVHPVGLVADRNDIFVRSPQQLDGTDIQFYCAVKKGMALRLLRGGDIVRDTGAMLRAARQAGQVSAILNFHCILRTLQLKSEGKTDDYGALFTEPTVGFSTYGESYVGHINQTSTMVVLR